MSGTASDDAPPARAGTLGHAQSAVDDLLAQSAAFQKLEPEQQRQIARDTAKVAAVLAEAAAASACLEAVDFPAFVAGLVKGIFAAVVDASIEQMEAYGRLVADVRRWLEPCGPLTTR